MTGVATEDIASYRGGQRRLMIVQEAGSYAAGTNKDGTPNVVSFAAGDVMLTDAVGHAIVAPIGMAGAVDIATRVIEGDDLRTICDTHSLRALATVVLAISLQPKSDNPEPEPAAPATRANE